MPSPIIPITTIIIVYVRGKYEPITVVIIIIRGKKPHTHTHTLWKRIKRDGEGGTENKKKIIYKTETDDPRQNAPTRSLK